jgi:DNA-binding response OmpR family regulator
MTLVLVIDADPSVRTAVRACLELRGLDALVVDDVAAGIDHFERFAIDLVIVDIFMPDIDGLEIIRRFSRRSSRVPVIATSGFLSQDLYATAPDFLRMAGELGAAFCLRKPFRPTQLTAAIDACLGSPLEEAGHNAVVMSAEKRIGGKLRKALHV